MPETVIPAPALVTIPVAGGGQFPVRRIFCVGRNYAEHAREMGHDPDRELPFFFTKPADAVLTADADMPYPHHDQGHAPRDGTGRRPRQRWRPTFPNPKPCPMSGAMLAGLDMTRRDIQGEAKKAGRPWDMAKGFDHSAPIGLLVPAAGVDSTKGLIELKVNGKIRQTSDLSKLIWSIPETIAYLSKLVKLAAGDLIFSGTPEGVAACGRGDLLEGMVEGVGTVTVKIV